MPQVRNPLPLYRCPRRQAPDVGAGDERLDAEGKVIVYLAVCRVNQKAYVGQTSRDIQYRFSRHKDDKKSMISHAIRKHGLENFDIAVLETCATQPETDLKERYWIARIGSRAPVGYNLSDGGMGAFGSTRSPETRAKMSAYRKALWRDPAYREKRVTEHWTKSPRASEIREIIAARTREQHRTGNLGGYRGGGVKTPESRAKASARGKSNWSDPAFRADQLAKRKAAKEGTK